MIDFVFSTLISSEIHRKILPLKILFILVSAFFLSVIIYSHRQTRWARKGLRQAWTEFRSFKPYDIAIFDKKWRKIKRRLEKGWESEAKLAIIEADELLDSVLKRMAYKGRTLEEKLDQMDEKLLSNLEEIKKIHGIRNDIIHDPDYHLSLENASSAIKVYEKTFKHLEAL